MQIGQNTSKQNSHQMMTSDESCLHERRDVEERRMEEEREGRGEVGRRKRKTGKTKGGGGQREHD